MSDTEYKLNEWTVAPANTRLFVFDSLQKAEEFRRFKIGDYQIYECLIVGGIKGFGAHWSADQARFWHCFNEQIKTKKKVQITSYKFPMALSPVPAILCKKVKLTKKVA